MPMDTISIISLIAGARLNSISLATKSILKLIVLSPIYSCLILFTYTVTALDSTMVSPILNLRVDPSPMYPRCCKGAAPGSVLLKTFMLTLSRI